MKTVYDLTQPVLVLLFPNNLIIYQNVDVLMKLCLLKPISKIKYDSDPDLLR